MTSNLFYRLVTTGGVILLLGLNNFIEIKGDLASSLQIFLLYMILMVLTE